MGRRFKTRLIGRAFALVLLFAVRFYQAAVSPLLGGGKCRFYPSCSEYAAEALKIYGPVIGAYLAASRLLKCGPWHEGGFDPVPGRGEIAARKWLGKLLKLRERTSKG